MIWGRIALRRLAKTFDMSLYRILVRLMGLNSVILEGLLVFGTRVILVLLMSTMDILEFKTFKTMLIIPLPTIS